MRTISGWLLFYKHLVAKTTHTHPQLPINTTVSQVQETTDIASNLKPGVLNRLTDHYCPNWLLRHCTGKKSVSAYEKCLHFRGDTRSQLTYIWNNGILSGGKESAVSRNLQADKYKMSSLWAISPAKGPFPSATETFLILLLFLQICKETRVINSFTSAGVYVPMRCPWEGFSF